ncbi:RibD family protein [Sphingomonas sp. LB2R24]|uniref:RibD family protein n=1 Tax=Sphingomonas sorbitolis TaxID=3096165 RepID=UPI002FC7A6EB
MKPHVICLMMSSIDGGLHPSRYTPSPDGTREEWKSVYERLHTEIAGDAWLVGRVTMGEMSKAVAHRQPISAPVSRPVHIAAKPGGRYAVAVDRSGKLHFDEGDIDGDHIVVLLGDAVDDEHLAELAGDGVSYIVAKGANIDLAAALDILGSEFGVRTLLVEGGGGINGSMLAAGMVDELMVLVAPALDGSEGGRRIVSSGAGGLGGQVGLTFRGATPLEHGVVLLTYDVKPY